MNLKQITEADLLALLKMTEEEQKQLLFQWGIRLRLNIECSTCGRVLCDYESLDDLAGRLWKEASRDCLGGLRDVMNEIKDNCKIWKSEYHIDYVWLHESKPIHRIVAALLAMKRADEAPVKSSVSGLGFTLYPIRKNR